MDVGQGGSARFVDQFDHFQAGDFGGVSGGGALVVVEVRRYCNHGFGYFLAEVVLGVDFELVEDSGAHFFGEDVDLVGFVVDFDFYFAVGTADEVVGERGFAGFDVGVVVQAPNEALYFWKLKIEVKIA